MAYWRYWAYAGPVVLGPFLTEEEANEIAYQKLPSQPFEVVYIDTKDKTAARDKIRYMRLGNESMDNIMQRAKYTVPDENGIQP